MLKLTKEFYHVHLAPLLGTWVSALEHRAVRGLFSAMSLLRDPLVHVAGRGNRREGGQSSAGISQHHRK